MSESIYVTYAGQLLTYGYSDKTTLSYAAIFDIKKGAHLGHNEYVGDIDFLREVIMSKLMLVH
jgi:hypothetical protein